MVAENWTNKGPTHGTHALNTYLQHDSENHPNMTPTWDTTMQNKESIFINIPLSYDPNIPMDPEIWGEGFHSISLYSLIEHIVSDAKNIKDSLKFMTKYITNKQVKPSLRPMSWMILIVLEMRFGISFHLSIMLTRMRCLLTINPLYSERKLQINSHQRFNLYCKENPRKSTNLSQLVLKGSHHLFQPNSRRRSILSPNSLKTKNQITPLPLRLSSMLKPLSRILAHQMLSRLRKSSLPLRWRKLTRSTK